MPPLESSGSLAQGERRVPIRATKFTRRLSPFERAYLAQDDISPPFAVQVCFEGEGELPEARWREAVASAARANLGTCVRLKGCLAWGRWEDTGRPPPVRTVDGHAWSGKDFEGAPFLKEPLSARKGPVSEVLLIEGEPRRVVFRAHHAALDATGVIGFARDVFRILRGEEPVGSRDARSAFELAHDLSSGKRPVLDLAPQSLPVTGPPRGSEQGLDWGVITVPGRVPNLLGRLGRIVADEVVRTADGAEGAVRITYPVDMRAHVRDLRSMGNLTSAVAIDVEPETTARDIKAEIERQFAAREDLDAVRILGPLRFFPLASLRGLLRRSGPRRHRSGRYPLSATISTAGMLMPEDFAGGGFRTRGIFGVTVAGFEMTPLLLGVVATPDEMRISASIPKVLANGGRLEALLAHISEELTR